MKTVGELRESGSVAIVGAGPGGATLARLLQGRGWRVKIYEREPSAMARPQGGSLDLRPDSGQRAIDAAGLKDVFARSSREEAKAFRMIDSQGKEMPGQGEETHEDAGPEIDRGELRRLLLDSLEDGTVAWDHEIDAVEPDDNGRWKLRISGRTPVVVDLVIGADGIGSKVRSQLTAAQPQYSGVTMLAANIRREMWRGSKVDALLGEGSVMVAGDQKTIFIQRCAHDLILLYYSLEVPQGWPKSECIDLNDKAKLLGKVRDSYADFSPELLDMLTQVEDQFQVWPTSFMPPDHCWPTRPGITMFGDASHAMPPFTGKGVNLALLDALELADGFSADAAADVTTVIAAFEKRMQLRTNEEIRACLKVGREMYGIEMDFDQHPES